MDIIKLTHYSRINHALYLEYFSINHYQIKNNYQVTTLYTPL